MRVICVDGDKNDLQAEVELCRANPAIDEANGANSAEEAMNLMKMGRADLALLAIDLPDRNGIELAEELRKLQPFLAIIFLAEDERYALDAYSVHPFGYLLKPLEEKVLDTQLNQFLLSRATIGVPHISVQTFGAFAVTVDGRAVRFERAKSKELLALLIDRKGGEVSRKIAFTEMWEDREYDVKAQNYFNVIVNSLRDINKPLDGKMLREETDRVMADPDFQYLMAHEKTEALYFNALRFHGMAFEQYPKRAESLRERETQQNRSAAEPAETGPAMQQG